MRTSTLRKAPVPCSGITHPRALDGERVVIGSLTYANLVCPTCGLSQGRKLIRKPRPIVPPVLASLVSEGPSTTGLNVMDYLEVVMGELSERDVLGDVLEALPQGAVAKAAFDGWMADGSPLAVVDLLIERACL